MYISLVKGSLRKQIVYTQATEHTMDIYPSNKPKLCAETLIYSRLPNNAFFDFSISHSVKNIENMEMDVGSTHGLLSKDQWSSIFGNSNSVIAQTENYKTVSKELNDLKAKENDKYDENGDYIMQNEIFDDFSDFDSYNDNFKNLVTGKKREVTVFVYLSSFSIDEFFYSLPCTVEASAVIKGTTDDDDDTLLLSLISSKILLIRFSYERNIQSFKPYVVFEYSTNAGHLSNILVSDKTDTVFFIHENVVESFKIHYNNKRIPFLLKHYNIPENVINATLLKISSTEEMLVYSSHEKNNTLSINGIQNLEDVNKLLRNKFSMKNTFEVPLNIIPLNASRSVLFLQESGYTIKHMNFFTGGEDTENHKAKYPDTTTKFVLNSYYIPKKKISVKGSDKLSIDVYLHDQVLISTSHNRTVFLLDIFYDTQKHTYLTKMTRLLKYKHTVSFFKFETIENTSNFSFIFANEMGVTESKIVKIVVENDIPILRPVTADRWSSLYPYPMIDYKIIDASNDTLPIEANESEFWALGGQESNNSIFKIKNGCTGKIISTIKSADAKPQSKLYPLKGDLIWVSDGKSNKIYKYNSVENTLVLEVDVPIEGKVIVLEYIGDKLCLISTRHMILFDAVLNIVKKFEFPDKCITAVVAGNTVSILKYSKITDTYGIVIFEIAEKSDTQVTFNNISFRDDQNNFKNLSMLKFVLINNVKYLFIGFIEGFINIFKQNGNKDEMVKLFTTDKLKQDMNDGVLKLKTNIFKPHDITCLNSHDLYILTSKEGDYSFLKIKGGQLNDITDWSVLGTFKLSDKNQIDIIKTNNNDILLKSDYLWKLDIKSSYYPKRVLFCDDFDSGIISCCKFNGSNGAANEIALLRYNDLSIVAVSNTTGTLVKSKKLNSKSMRMVPLSNGLIMLIPIPGVVKQADPIQFFDYKRMKLLKNGESINKLFEEDAIPLCGCEIAIDKFEQKYYYVAVGCIKKKTEGCLKIFQILKNKTTKDVEVKPLTPVIKTESPITDLKCILEDRLRLFLSSNCDILSFSIESGEKFLIDQDVFNYHGTEPIKKFEIVQQNSKLEKVPFYTDLLVTLRNNTVMKLRYMHTLNDTTNDKIIPEYRCSDIICNNHTDFIVADYQKGTLSLCNQQLVKYSEINVGYTPRLSLIKAYPPWIPTKNRSLKNSYRFVAVGLNGEVRLYTSDTNTEAIKNTKKRRIVELSDYKNSFVSETRGITSKYHETDANVESLQRELLYNLVDI